MNMRHTGVLLWIYIGLSLLDSLVICSPALPHVTHYDVVRLQKLNVNGRTRRSASSQQPFPDEMHFGLPVDGKNYTLRLEKNRGLIGEDYTLIHYEEDGAVTTTGPEATDHCYYHGYIPGLKDSSVSVGVCSGMHGVVSADQQVYLIEPLEGSVEGNHAVYRPEHLRRRSREKRSSSGGNQDVDVLYDNTPRPLGMRSRTPLKAQRFIELVVVMDSSEYKHYKTKKQVEEFILGVTNHVDKLYQPLNLRVILVGLEIWSRDQIVVTSTPSDLLNRFVEWQRDDLKKRKKHDNAQFVTAVDFEGSTVGLAFLSVMCFDKSGGVNQDRHDGIHSLASTMAHEMGHNLGMSHDKEDCYCGRNAKSCVMADTIGFDYPERFSSCSQLAYKTFLEDYNPSCLLNKPRPDQVFGAPVCGNAFLEKGEECDCGTPEDCTNRCCNATTCRLTEGSQCAEGECCQDCKFKAAGVMCRPSVHDCDLAEHCPGSSADCPRDVYRMNGSPCDRNRGYCYNGQCPSHQQQCHLLWGEAADTCATHGCTSRRNCDVRQKRCGNVLCRGGKFRHVAEYAMLTWPGQCIELTSISNGLDGLRTAATGTKCHDNMVCVEGRCQDLAVYGTKDCADKCNSRGVCNHDNECHCDPGWAPPYCTQELPNQETGPSGVVIGVCVTIAVLLLLTLVIAGLSCCRSSLSKPRPAIKGRREVRTSSGQANPMFQAGSAKNSPLSGPPRISSGPPRISSPTFLESTATQSCRPLDGTALPSRTASQPPQKPSVPLPPRPQVKPAPPANKPLPVASPQLPVLSHKPQAPSRPLPPLTPKPANKPTPPPVPPVKPNSSPSPWKSEIPVGQKMALIPPRGAR
ncbi:disintegrin and metalloproteinase domain-containing protein 8a isoform X1 [Alosa pseudoharengus]|uniref:disintegrin and metalloproteinase domain-containing protein 8a isoform X1 n=2 Tax=Alosa pseudoharengus TaxID=34774 RepID=UPI003F88CC7C